MKLAKGRAGLSENKTLAVQAAAHDGASAPPVAGWRWFSWLGRGVLEELDAITEHTKVRLRPQLRITLDNTGPAVSLQYNDRATLLAHPLAGAARHILGQEGTFIGADLPPGGARAGPR